MNVFNEEPDVILYSTFFYSFIPLVKDSQLSALRRRIASVSTGPGVYRWLDASGHVLYVGKAKNLRNRMQHYVQAAKKHSAWIEIMVRQIHDFDITVTNTELEALLLETNLIKELRPKYNVMMKDDKNYVYLRISVGDTFPRVDIVRRMEDDQPSLKLRPAGGALYFGPKTSAEQLRETLAFLRTLFPFRNCKMGISLTPDPSPDGGGEKQQGGSPFSLRGKGLGMGDRLPLEVVCRDRDRPTPCIDHHIKQCLAPCIGTVTPEQYRLQAIDGVVAFFQGKHQETERILTERMQEAAKAKKFERAAKLRNQLEKLKKTQEKQLISDTSHANTDTVGASLLSGHAYIVLLRERDGKLIGEENFSLQGTAESLADVLGQFLPQYFGALSDLPDTIVVGEEPTDREAIESWLQSLRNRRVRLVIPERGKKSKLLLLAEKNADWKARQTEAKWEAETRKTEEALKELQALLKLPVPPRRIEGYDISHLGGTHTVGSMVVFHHGKPKREHYRSFNVRTVEGKVDDYRALAEMLRRRFKYLADDLDASMKRWQEKGIVFGKARKAEQAVIVTISKAYPEDIGADAINYRHYIVARYGKEIVGFCRLFQYPGNVQTLRSLWIKKEWRGEKLGHTLIRMLLRRLTKGKLYVHISKDSLLEYYMELDFQPVRTPLPVLQKQLDVWEKAHPGSPVGMILVYIVAQQKLGESFSETPDILLIDGGKGQLGVAVQVLKEFGLEIPVAGLAKREEEIFVPGKADPLLVVQDSAARFLLQRVRDEAHRFANSKREGRQKASTFHSQLDEIPGIGEATKKALLKRFGTADAVFAAADEELRQILTQSQVDELRKG